MWRCREVPGPRSCSERTGKETILSLQKKKIKKKEKKRDNKPWTEGSASLTWAVEEKSKRWRGGGRGTGLDKFAESWFERISFRIVYGMGLDEVFFVAYKRRSWTKTGVPFRRRVLYREPARRGSWILYEWPILGRRRISNFITFGLPMTIQTSTSSSKARCKFFSPVDVPTDTLPCVQSNSFSPRNIHRKSNPPPLSLNIPILYSSSSREKEFRFAEERRGETPFGSDPISPLSLSRNIASKGIGGRGAANTRRGILRTTPPPPLKDGCGWKALSKKRDSRFWTVAD